MFRIMHRICVFTVSAAGATLSAAGAFAQTATTSPVVTYTTGMTGVADGQTTRLNVLNPGVQPPAIGAVCSAVISFLDSGGNVLKTTAVSVAPGTAAAPFDISAADLSVAAGTREEIRATITIPAIVPVSTSGASTSPTPSCTLIGTVEIFDSVTRRTESQLGGFHEVPSAPVSTSN
jgi:hypothetical protein